MQTLYKQKTKPINYLFINQNFSIMKKFLLVAACFALTLSSCIKDDVSQSVEEVRISYAEMLKAKARLADAEAAAITALSEAEAALKAAEAAAMAIQNQILDIERQIKEVELEAAKAQLEVLLAQLEAQKATILAEMEAAALEAEKALVEAQKELERVKDEYANLVDGLEAAKAAKLIALYNKYADLTSEVLAAKAELTIAQMDLASAEQDLVDVKEAKEAQIAEADEVIATMNRLIANEQKKIEIAEKYQTATLEETQAALDAAITEEFELEKALEAQAAAYNALADQFDAMDPDAQPLVEFLASDPLGLASRFGDTFAPSVGYEYDENGVFWYGFYVEDNDPYTATSDPDSWEFPAGWEFIRAYTYAGTAYDYSGDYLVLTNLDQYNKEAFEVYYPLYLETDRAYYESAIESYGEYLAIAENSREDLKGFADVAKAMADAYNNWNFLVLDTTTEYIVDYVNYTQTITTFGLYNKANLAYNGGTDNSGFFPVEVEGTQTALAAAEAALEAAEAAVEDAEGDEAKAAAEEELKWAQKYYDLAEAADKVAEAEFDAAVKALEAQKKLVDPAEKAFVESRREYEYYYAAHKSTVGQYVDYIYVDAGGAMIYVEYDGYEPIDYNATYNYILGRVSMNAEDIAYYSYAIEEYQYYLDVYFNMDTQIADFLATLEAADAEAAKFIEEFNALSKAVYEAELTFVEAAEAYDAKAAEVTALRVALAGVDLLLQELEGYKANIAGYEENIADMEAVKADLYNVTTAEDLVETLKVVVDLAESKVAMYEALAKEAKAAWEAACNE